MIYTLPYIGKSLYAIPTLPQSALLNSLPNVQNELISEMQAYLESFVQLINPTRRQIDQIEKKDSILWLNLQINAQRALGMYIYNNDDLLPNLKTKTAETENEAENRKFYTNTQLMEDFQKSELRKRYLSNLKYDVIKLVTASKYSQVGNSLRYMRNSLSSLAEIAYLLTPCMEEPLPPRQSFLEYNNSSNISDEFIYTEEDKATMLTGPYMTIPRLIGMYSIV